MPLGDWGMKVMRPGCGFFSTFCMVGWLIYLLDYFPCVNSLNLRYFSIGQLALTTSNLTEDGLKSECLRMIEHFSKEIDWWGGRRLEEILPLEIIEAHALIVGIFRYTYIYIIIYIYIFAISNLVGARILSMLPEIRYSDLLGWLEIWSLQGLGSWVLFFFTHTHTYYIQANLRFKERDHKRCSKKQPPNIQWRRRIFWRDNARINPRAQHAGDAIAFGMQQKGTVSTRGNNNKLGLKRTEVRSVTPRYTNIAMENGAFEDVFPIENGGYSIQLC